MLQSEVLQLEVLQLEGLPVYRLHFLYLIFDFSYIYSRRKAS